MSAGCKDDVRFRICGSDRAMMAWLDPYRNHSFVKLVIVLVYSKYESQLGSFHDVTDAVLICRRRRGRI
jgi:hypothetical protein